MKYTYDLKMFVTAYVVADSEEEALQIIKDWAGYDELGAVNDKLSIGSGEIDGEPDYVDEEDFEIEKENDK